LGGGAEVVAVGADRRPGADDGGFKSRSRSICKRTGHPMGAGLVQRARTAPALCGTICLPRRRRNDVRKTMSKPCAGDRMGGLNGGWGKQDRLAVRALLITNGC